MGTNGGFGSDSRNWEEYVHELGTWLHESESESKSVFQEIGIGIESV